jgi:hypothetical protein
MAAGQPNGTSTKRRRDVIDEPSEEQEDEDSVMDPSKCYILNLPYELRQEIYKHLLTVPHPSKSSAAHPQKLHPAILSTCTAIHDEAEPVLYTTNTFHAHSSLLASFPRLRPQGNPISTTRLSSLISRIIVRVRLDAGAAFSNSRAARELSGKEEVTVECRQSSFRGSGPQVLRLFEGVRGVRRARIVGSTTGFEDYARWLEGAMMAEKGVEVKAFRPETEGRDGDDDDDDESSEPSAYFGPLGKNVRWDGCNFVM